MSLSFATTLTVQGVAVVKDGTHSNSWETQFRPALLLCGNTAQMRDLTARRRDEVPALVLTAANRVGDSF